MFGRLTSALFPSHEPSAEEDGADRKSTTDGEESNERVTKRGRRSQRTHMHAQVWARSFMMNDPRRQIAEYFKPGDHRGPLGYLESNGWHAAPDAPHSHFFAVWRPTSLQALQMMMAGKATGKALNVKGKSAKEGVLSGFVPFVQISEEAHKKKVGTSPRDGRLSIYFQSQAARERVVLQLGPILGEIQYAGRQAMEQLHEWKEGTLVLDEHRIEPLCIQELWFMDEPQIRLLDEHAPKAWGIDIPERLFMEAFVMRQDISHPQGWDTGRPSEPAYMDLNLHSTRDGKLPKVVVWQYDENNPMNPRGLLVAHAEGQIKPVASDVDAFLMGSKGMDFEQLPDEQVSLCEWTIECTARVLSAPKSQGWMRRWLELLKDEHAAGFHPPEAKIGYGDRSSIDVMTGMAKRLAVTGAVRHGAESFNFYFPQDIDPEYLVVWEGFDGAAWRYLKPAELQLFLLARVAEDYAFPLNPKWMLCDKGWWEVYEALEANPKTAPVLDAWFPPASGLRKRMHELHRQYPEGFVTQGAEAGGPSEDNEPLDMEMAEYELSRHQAWLRVKSKLVSLVMMQGGLKLGYSRESVRQSRVVSAPDAPRASAKPAAEVAKAAKPRGAPGLAAAPGSPAIKKRVSSGSSGVRPGTSTPPASERGQKQQQRGAGSAPQPGGSSQSRGSATSAKPKAVASSTGSAASAAARAKAAGLSAGAAVAAKATASAAGATPSTVAAPVPSDAAASVSPSEISAAPTGDEANSGIPSEAPVATTNGAAGGATQAKPAAGSVNGAVNGGVGRSRPATSGMSGASAGMGAGKPASQMKAQRPGRPGQHGIDSNARPRSAPGGAGKR